MNDLNNKNQATVWPFDELPTPIKNWLKSDSVTAIVEELNKKYNGINEAAIPFSVTWIPIGSIKPEKFIEALIFDFKIDPAVAKELAEQIKSRIFYPIRAALKNELGIDIERLTAYQDPRQVNQANEMKMEKVPPRTVDLRGTTSPAEAAHPGQPPVTAPPPPKAPEPKTEKADQPFHLVEEAPAQEAQPPVQSPQQGPQ